jgi:hypothetical protein
MKIIPNSISIVTREDGHPIYDCIQVGIDTEGGGSFLVIEGHDEYNDGQKIGLDWEEWDAIVKVVNEHREVWDTDES